MISVVDEVLSESTPKFEIKDANNNVLYTNITIAMITSIVQAGTNLNKALFDSIALDFTHIEDGTTIVGKAYADEDGTNIKTNYAKKTSLATVATSGSYNDLSDKPSLTVDTTLDDQSSNAIANSAVATALEGKQATLTFDASPTIASTNPVESGGVYTALEGKQDTLTFDITPTSRKHKSCNEWWCICSNRKC